MSISLSFRFSPESTSAAAGPPQTFTAALPIRLARRLADIRRRRAERCMAELLEKLDHPGVIADFRRASRG